MCFKKWFCKPDPIMPITGNKVALLFAINDYMGYGNDLQGCLNDIDDVEKKLNNEFPGFQIKKFKDSEVTTYKFISEIENAIKTILLPGVLYIHYSGHGTQIPNIQEMNKYDEALYLYNGPLIDDNIWILQQKTPEGLKVVAKFDSCFSGDIGRNINLNPRFIKNRFYKIPGLRVMKKAVRKINKSASDKWIIFSGCGEEQTASDAWFDNRANGAFSYYDNQSYKPGATYNDEIYKLKTYLPGNGFDQIPELSGNESLFYDLVLT